MEENKRRALGRGLEELFNNEVLDYSKVEEKIINETKQEEIVNLKIEDLRPNPYQPRKTFDEKSLKELADSIKEHGIFQPIIAKKSIKGYEIIAGERRVRAASLANLDEVPAIVKDFNDKEMMEIALLENLQRENLNAIEEAEAYNKLQTSLNLTQENLAKRLGKSRSHITNMLGLLSLPQEVQKAIKDKKITMSHARVISKLDDKEEQINLTNKIIQEDLSVRTLEELSSNNNYVKTNKQTKTKKTNEYKLLQDFLCEKIGTKVKIANNKLEIKFTNTSDLNRILEILNIEMRG